MPSPGINISSMRIFLLLKEIILLLEKLIYFWNSLTHRAILREFLSRLSEKFIVLRLLLLFLYIVADGKKAKVHYANNEKFELI